MDKRWKELGKLLVNYSTSVQPNERVMIAMTEIETYPLVQAVYEACVQAGAHPQVQFLSEKLNRSLLKYGSDQQIEWIPEIEAYGMEWADVYIGLRGAHNLKVFWDIPSPKLAQLRRSMGKISTLRWEKTRWCLVRVPNASLAQEAEMDEETITDMFFNACLLDWSEISEKWNRWATLLSQGSEIRILGYKTDLHFSVKGRSWQVANGKINMPDGEIMTSPDDSTVEGEIYFKFPGVLGGRLMYDVHLQWQKGELVKATSSTHQDFLQSTIQSDPGASRIGEFAFGTNPEVKYFCKDILLDEKIGGTIHIALGRAYPETGGTNKSAIHWDIVKDMRKEGEVYLDGNLIFQKGKMLI